MMMSSISSGESANQGILSSTAVMVSIERSSFRRILSTFFSPVMLLIFDVVNVVVDLLPQQSYFV